MGVGIDNCLKSDRQTVGAKSALRSRGWMVGDFRPVSRNVDGRSFTCGHSCTSDLENSFREPEKVPDRGKRTTLDHRDRQVSTAFSITRRASVDLLNYSTSDQTMTCRSRGTLAYP